ncbi:RNA polymerase sigma factor [Breznakiella homolactica]|uniref:Sigma-70 family RNA polymerase sigma factor n=1 Tax=Breznakiella homolactica TaxID=2798577 RepID=A0A7T7XNC3_9SPIR|nr:sigma-70 family RNA polymerase sigma factor [Breznakiella homolactica]QQO09491.1 sigma-70 family RNA polymerase sigma factor [Breznakiella homolactica]
MESHIDVERYYEKYAPMVYRRCKQMLRSEEDALDAVQDVFFKLIKSSKRLRNDFPSSLLYTMATNTCLNRLRWKKRHSETGHDEAGEGILLSVDRSYDHVDAKLLVEHILSTESETTRAICFMYHADGMTLDEIGKAMGMSISGVRKRLVTFHKRARIKIEEGDEL